MPDDELRLFYALPLQGELRFRLAQRCGQVRLRAEELGITARWVVEKNWHLTLRFVGNQPPERLEALGDALMRAASGQRAPHLMLGRLGTFGDPRHARVLFAEIGGEIGMVRSLVERLEAELTRLGIVGERRPWRPHLTLARLAPQRAVQHLVSETTPFGMAYCPERVTLYRSHLGSTGASYESLAQVSLCHGDPS